MKMILRGPVSFAAAGLLLLACGSGTTPAASSPTAAPVGSPTASSAPAVAAAPAGATMVVKEINASGMGGAFDPPTLAIHVGDTVQWENASGNIHNVTFADPGMKTPIMYGGEKYSITFPKAGTFKYTCTFHPGMDGTIVVS